MYSFWGEKYQLNMNPILIRRVFVDEFPLFYTLILIQLFCFIKKSFLSVKYNIYSNDNFYWIYSAIANRLSSDIVSQYLFLKTCFELHGGSMPVATGRFNSSAFNVILAYFPSLQISKLYDRYWLKKMTYVYVCRYILSLNYVT